jgi:hypothetical protein
MSAIGCIISGQTKEEINNNCRSESTEYNEEETTTKTCPHRIVLS